MPKDQDMQATLRLQKQAHLDARPEPMALRRDRIKRAIALLKDNAETFSKTMSADFGNRSPHLSMLADIAASVKFGNFCLKHMDGWAQPERRGVQFPLGLLGAKAEVRYEAKGVIGILSPWNFPVNLAFAPLMQVFAAGNRAMIKPSEFTERTSLLMRELVEEAFTPDELAVFTGGPEVAQEFSSLAFDHLIFTGSTPTGRKVMEAAAKNLVPVTLELGGKSPVFLGRSADYEKAGEKIAWGKMMNAGQICISPDYLLVPSDKEDAAVAAVELGARKMYPSLLDNDDYASIVSDRHFDRLKSVVEDARSKGAKVTEVNPANEDFSSSNARKMPLTILQGVTDDMQAMQEEIFGPVLPVKTYSSIDEAISYVNENDRPLALYYFGQDSGEQKRVLTRTISGGVTVNDVIFHQAVEEMPFGGSGASGMGAYHGVEGFREFSHARAIYTQSKLDIAKMGGMKPPFGKASEKAAKLMMK